MRTHGWHERELQTRHEKQILHANQVIVRKDHFAVSKQYEIR